jgi:hypothetical protein
VHQQRYESLAARWRSALLACARNEVLRLGAALGYTRGLEFSPGHSDAARTSLLQGPSMGPSREPSMRLGSRKVLSGIARHRPSGSSASLDEISSALHRTSLQPGAPAGPAAATGPFNGDPLPILITPPRALQSSISRRSPTTAMEPLGGGGRSNGSTPHKATAPGASSSGFFDGLANKLKLDNSASSSGVNISAGANGGTPSKKVSFFDMLTETVKPRGPGAGPPVSGTAAAAAAARGSGGAHRRNASEAFVGFHPSELIEEGDESEAVGASS